MQVGYVRIQESSNEDVLVTINYVYSTKPDGCDDIEDQGLWPSDSPASYQVDMFTTPSTFEYLLNLDDDKYNMQVSVEVCPISDGAIRFRGWGYEHSDTEWHIGDKLDSSQHENAVQTTLYVTSKKGSARGATP